mmetsp:Transcript_4496/g.12664  ORF Transcript_4496/g.12664 Transcript_4496/m.12664 type:complete len:317 (-) Transcript_4496:90-1040(-)
MFALKSILSKETSPSSPPTGGGGGGGKVTSQTKSRPAQQKFDQDDQDPPHITALSDDVLRLILKSLPPKETSSLLRTCKSLAKLAADAWKFKLNAMRDEYVIPYEERARVPTIESNRDTSSSNENSAPTPARHCRDELQKRHRRLNRYRPNIERWGEEPYWYVNHPCPTSSFNAVRRAHDVTDFRVSVQTSRLEKGRYRAYWKVNSTSGFCVLQLDTEVYTSSRSSEQPGGGSMRDQVQNFSSLWNTREDRGKGWTEVCATGEKVIEIGSDGGYIKARMWKRELDFTGGILVDCLEIKKIERVPPLMGSRLLMSSW